MRGSDRGSSPDRGRAAPSRPADRPDAGGGGTRPKPPRSPWPPPDMVTFPLSTKTALNIHVLTISRFRIELYARLYHFK